MNRAQRRAAGRNNACVDCGTHRIASHADDGWLCLPCLDKRNERLNQMVMEQGLMLPQRIDPDGAPVPCGCKGCTRDATVIVKVRMGDNLGGVYGCDEHASRAVTIAQRHLEQQQ